MGFLGHTDHELAGRDVADLGEGVGVEPDALDHVLAGGTHVVHLTSEARRTGGTAGDVTAGLDTRPIRGVQFVKLADLPSLGFGARFAELATAWRSGTWAKVRG
jgi:hypothetical protein